MTQARTSAHLPLRLVLIAPFVGLVFLAVAAVGSLSFRNGQIAVHQVAETLHDQISDRLTEHLRSYLDRSHLANQTSSNFLRQHPGNPTAITQFFWRQLQVFPALNTIYYGTSAGEQFSARRERGGGYSIGIRQAATNWQYRRYRVRLNGQISQLFNTDPKFDPRRRPWYQ
ncbi:MAG: hypothetical protein SFT94_02980, partial [Pseudanabaenaceae cyanobacterium bins.68]|nr:hypothetical protein [Pseudanabaenaceae cyanobacterium bins.68]